MKAGLAEKVEVRFPKLGAALTFGPVAALALALAIGVNGAIFRGFNPALLCQMSVAQVGPTDASLPEAATEIGRVAQHAGLEEQGPQRERPASPSIKRVLRRSFERGKGLRPGPYRNSIRYSAVPGSGAR